MKNCEFCNEQAVTVIETNHFGKETFHVCAECYERETGEVYFEWADTHESLSN